MSRQQLDEALSHPHLDLQQQYPQAQMDQLPDVTLSFMLSFLHGFDIAGRPACTCKAFAASCRSDVLCLHVLDRDFKQEEAQESPLQPLRSSRHSPPQVVIPLSLEALLHEARGNGGMDGGASSSQLRCLTNALCCKSFVSIGHSAAKEGRPALLEWAGNRCDLNHLDADLSALMVAAVANHPVTTAVAVKFCALGQQRGKFGTALHQAAYVGAAAAVLELICAGASVQDVNSTYAQTPLHVACSRNHGDVARLLLGSDADPYFKDIDGCDALRIATMMGSTEAMEVLHQHILNPHALRASITASIANRQTEAEAPGNR